MVFFDDPFLVSFASNNLPADRTFKDSFSAVLGNEQFAIENVRGHKGWDWSSFSTWMESPHFFHLYFNPRSFFIIPKDAFDGDEEQEARKIFAAKIKK